jgi:hypothetical protein
MYDDTGLALKDAGFPILSYTVTGTPESEKNKPKKERAKVEADTTILNIRKVFADPTSYDLMQLLTLLADDLRPKKESKTIAEIEDVENWDSDTLIAYAVVSLWDDTHKTCVRQAITRESKADPNKSAEKIANADQAKFSNESRIKLIMAACACSREKATEIFEAQQSAE